MAATYFPNHYSVPSPIAKSIYEFCPISQLGAVNTAWRGLQIQILREELINEIQQFVSLDSKKNLHDNVRCFFNPKSRLSKQNRLAKQWGIKTLKMIDEYLPLHSQEKGAHQDGSEPQFEKIQIIRCLFFIHHSLNDQYRLYNSSCYYRKLVNKFSSYPLLRLERPTEGVGPKGDYERSYPLTSTADIHLLCSIRRFVENERPELATRVLEQLHPRLKELPQKCVRVADLWISQNKPEGALKCISLLPEQNTVERLQILQSLVKGYIKSGQFECAFATADKILNADILHSSEYYVQLLLEEIYPALKKAHRFQEARNILNTAHETIVSRCVLTNNDQLKFIQNELRIIEGPRGKNCIIS